jgi:hypothetical protein
MCLPLLIDRVEEEGSVLLQTWMNNMRGNTQLRVLLMAKTAATLRLIVPALEGMHLEELDVSGCSMEPETASILTQHISSSDTLKSINASNCNLSAEAVGYMLARLTCNTRLPQTYAYFANNPITTLSPEVLSNALMNNHNLHTLDLSGIYLNEEGLFELFGCLMRNGGTLDTLSLDDDFTYYISSHVSGVRTAHALADMIQQTGLKCLSMKGRSSAMTGLKTLSVQAGVSSDAKRVLIPLLDRLKRNDTLLELDISNNQLGNAIAVSIADVLRYNTHLVSLNCDNNRITLNGWAAIGVAFRHNRTLQHFAFPVTDSQKCGSSMSSIAKQTKLFAILTSIQLATNVNQAGGLHPRLVAKRLQDPLSAPPLIPTPPGSAPAVLVPVPRASSSSASAILSPTSGPTSVEDSWAAAWDSNTPVPLPATTDMSSSSSSSSSSAGFVAAQQPQPQFVPPAQMPVPEPTPPVPSNPYDALRQEASWQSTPVAQDPSANWQSTTSDWSSTQSATSDWNSQPANDWNSQPANYSATATGYVQQPANTGYALQLEQQAAAAAAASNAGYSSYSSSPSSSSPSSNYSTPANNNQYQTQEDPFAYEWPTK